MEPALRIRPGTRPHLPWRRRDSRTTCRCGCRRTRSGGSPRLLGLYCSRWSFFDTMSSPVTACTSGYLARAPPAIRIPAAARFMNTERPLIGCIRPERREMGGNVASTLLYPQGSEAHADRDPDLPHAFSEISYLLIDSVSWDFISSPRGRVVGHLVCIWVSYFRRRMFFSLPLTMKCLHVASWIVWFYPFLCT